MAKDKPPHGTRSRYEFPHRCRCAKCSKANRDYKREYMRKRRAA